jgi:hypothetical protein
MGFLYIYCVYHKKKIIKSRDCLIEDNKRQFGFMFFMTHLDIFLIFHDLISEDIYIFDNSFSEENTKQLLLLKN